MLRAMPDCALSQACNRLKKGRTEATEDTSTVYVWQNKLQPDVHLYQHTAAALNMFCALLHIGEPRYDGVRYAHCPLEDSVLATSICLYTLCHS